MANNPQVCGPFSQTLFLGASIISFSARLGWNGDQGALEVEVVEDACRGNKVYYDGAGIPRITNQPDFFNPPKMGSPVFFQFGSFNFGGILQGWEEQVDAKGGKIYSIKVVDGSELLEGTQVIINNYTGGVFGVPNLINAFGYNEEFFSACNTLAYIDAMQPPLNYTPAFGFGGANVAEDGMSWFQIKFAIENMQGFATRFGGPIVFRDNVFVIDLTELPPLDPFFRFTGESLSVLELISQVCSATGLDFFTELLFFAPNSVPGGWGGISGQIHPDVIKFIKVRVVSRQLQRISAYNVDLTVGSPVGLRLNFGQISNFVGNGAGRNRSARGLELRNDITNSFLVGDSRQDLWMQSYGGSGNTFTDTIWPYWGQDINGPIISNGFNDNHNFTVSTDGFGPDLQRVLGSTYNMSVFELRAAMTGMEEWALFMSTAKRPIADALGMDSSFTLDLLTNLAGIGAIPTPTDGIRTDATAANLSFNAAAGPYFIGIDLAELQKRFFEIVRSYAQLMGKKFMVALPLVCVYPDSSAPFSLKVNWEPSDGAWTDAPVQISPFASALYPDSPILELFRQDDGRIGCFVYFNTGGAPIDYSQLNPDDVVPLSTYECYVKATVEDKIIFLDPFTPAYPRAIVTLSNHVAVQAAYPGEVDAGFMNGFLGFFGFNPSFISQKVTSFGDDLLKLPLSPMPLLPLGAAVPLRSTNLSYGPWVTSLALGPAAKTQYERDTSLSPWAFGNTNVMNFAGQIKVESQVTQMIVSESGSFTVPGSPPCRLGDVLLAGGPEVTNIDTEVSTGGVTTSLRLRTFVPNWGELGRRRIQTLRQLGTYQQKLQRALLRRIGENFVQKRYALLTRPFDLTDRNNRQSSHTVICGEMIVDYNDPDLVRTNVVITDLRKSMPSTYQDYQYKAVMDLNGLFRPFESSDQGNGMPHCLQVFPTSSNPVTSITLFPFKPFEPFNGTSFGHDVEILTRDSGIYDVGDLSIKKSGDYGNVSMRGIGLRAPLLLVGWGFDVRGKPVPNASEDPINDPSDNFVEDYLQKPNTWKAGPLDARWNEQLGIWQCGMKIYRAIALGTLAPGGTSTAAVFGVANEMPLKDDVYRNCLFENESFNVFIDGDGYAKPVGENGLKRRIKTLVPIAPGDVGLCQFYSNAAGGEAGIDYVEASWMVCNTTISGNTEAIAEWFPEDLRWRITNAACGPC